MSSVLVRGLSAETVERLKKRAASRNRSLQAEMKTILEEAADGSRMENAARLAGEMRAKLAGRSHTDSVEMLREDRER